MDDILKGLNLAQRAAVSSDASVLQVLAPPGSGKTKTLTARVAYLIAKRGLRPWDIIVQTFTIKAANEMKERITAFVGEQLSKQLKLGTFHSIALRYLRIYGQHIGLTKDFGIADSSDSKAILKRLIKELRMSIEPGQALGRISSRKAKGDCAPEHKKGPTTTEQQDFQKLFNEYQTQLAASNLLDYDDILLKCCFLLKTHPQCVSNVQAVLVDEFQDTNNVQYDLMRLFAQHSNTITIVGDPDQSIYGFRSAEIKNLSRMRQHWPDTLTINLEENYRSSGAILHAAQNIIEQDESRPPKKLQATHSFGLRPVLRKLPSAYAEAEWLVSEIRRVQALSGNMFRPSDFAVLLRSAALSRTIETALGNAGIPYKMVGGTKFYDRFEVKLVLDYLRAINQPNNSEVVERIVNVPARGIGEASVKKLREEAVSKGVSLWTLILSLAQGRCTSAIRLTENAMKGLSSFVNVVLCGQKKAESLDSEQPSLVDVINVVAQKISLHAYLKSRYSDDETFETRWGNVEELLAQVKDLTAPGRVEALIESEALPYIEGIEQRGGSAQELLSVFLSNVALTASAEQKAEEGTEQVQQVTISTIHAAKGLEWPVVFVPASYDGSIPHSRADDNDEERRLLYVGMTRAQAMLYLSCPIKNSQREETSLSPFLTAPGVAKLFEEHGPSLSAGAISSLSVTLRRCCPTDATIEELKSTLEHDEDNYWPVNGEEALRHAANGGYANSTACGSGYESARIASCATSRPYTMQHQGGFPVSMPTVATGFTSVADRYDELMDQATSKRIDKRGVEREGASQVTNSKKRPAEEQGNIASFFGKRSRSTAKPVAVSATPVALRDVSNTVPTQAFRATREYEKLTARKPCTTPISNRPTSKQPREQESTRYCFLSSSPPKPEGEREEVQSVEPPSSVPAGMLRPASTFHTTSVAQANSQRRTLGVRRSLHGWRPREGHSGRK